MPRSMASGPSQPDAVLPERKLAVMGNPTLLQQVLLNLGTNAFQVLRDGTGRVEVGLEEVTLVDTGLGLAVAHGIVEAQGGAIAVASEVGRGRTFDVYLSPVNYESKPIPLEATLDEPCRGHWQHVLYVDVEVVVLMVQGLLQRLGCRATCVLDAHEAITMVERNPAAFDVVVTDINRPSCSGLDVVRALASIRSDLPVAISSGSVSDELRLQSAEPGVRGVMQKEHTLEQLGWLVHSALETKPDKAGPRNQGPDESPPGS